MLLQEVAKDIPFIAGSLVKFRQEFGNKKGAVTKATAPKSSHFSMIMFCGELTEFLQTHGFLIDRNAVAYHLEDLRIAKLLMDPHVIFSLAILPT